MTDEALTHPIRVVNEVKAQCEAGATVHVLSFGSHRQPREQVYVREVQHRHVPFSPKVGKFKALAADLPMYDWLTAPSIGREIKAFRPDVVHVHNIYLFGGLRRVLDRVNRPLVVLDLAENIPEIMQSYDHVNQGWGRLLIRKGRWKRREEAAMQNADFVVFVTQEAAQEAMAREAIDGSKVILMSNLVWPDSIGKEGPPPVLPDGDLGLYFGDTGMRRGMRSMLEGFDIAADQWPRLRLVVVGFNAREQDKLEALRATLRHADRVYLEGFQPMNRLGHYLEKAAIGFCPILRNVHHDTTHANKLFQYMHAGIPMLVSDCPSQVSLVNRVGGGVVHRAGDPEDFARQLLSMLVDEDGMKRMSANAVKAGQGEWTWPEAIQVYMEKLGSRVQQ